MRRIALMTLLATLTLAGSAGAVNVARFQAVLQGSEEVPPVTTVTVGQSQVDFEFAGNLVAVAKIRLDLQQATRATQAHLHCAPAGVAGPIVAFIAGLHDRGFDVNGRWIDELILTDANVIPTVPGASCPETLNTLTDLALAARRGNIYVNVHTLANTGGEVRGQLEP